jgi:membrane-associated protease RseP (regulator of RpoE activity)
MKNNKIHFVLFLITLATTFLAGFFQGGNITSGVTFSAALIFILGAHEMGHYFYGKRYGVDITPPYFIPAPPIISPIGTFGAFIKIKSPISTKRALFDIGIAGPLVGICAAIPIIIIGIKFSKIIDSSSREFESGMALGSPLIFSFLSDTFFGKVPEGKDLLLHPVAFAGWIGLFVTALNLIPAGQLDGGHIMYALFPRRWHRRASISMIVLLLILGVGTQPIIQLLQSFWKGFPLGSYKDLITFNGWLGWIMWAVLLSIMGTRHPPTMDDDIPLDGKRKLLGVVALFVFICCFTPIPVGLAKS